ncbi:MAG: RpiB/LacA/LacB family sugar-phosphate isomerase [Bdellovibrionales bacterium]
MLSEETIKKKFKTIFVASDHAGLEMKNHLLGRFPFLPWKDLGTMTPASVDYPDYAEKLCLEMKPRLKETCGVLICGSGQGMAMRANRFPFIRAALCSSEEIATLARLHNDANVLCLGGRLTPLPVSEKILSAFLETTFEGGRHQGRVDKLNC